MSLTAAASNQQVRRRGGCCCCHFHTTLIATINQPTKPAATLRPIPPCNHPLTDCFWHLPAAGADLDEEESAVCLAVILKILQVLRDATVRQAGKDLRLALKQLQLLPVLEAAGAKQQGEGRSR